MLQFFLIGFGIFLLWGVASIYSDHEEEKDKAKGDVMEYNLENKRIKTVEDIINK